MSGRRRVRFVLFLLLFLAGRSLPAKAGEISAVTPVWEGGAGIQAEETMTLVICGEGFFGQEELFRQKAAETAAYLLETAPFDAVRDHIRICSLYLPEETYGCHFGLDGTSRLLGMEPEEEKKAEETALLHCPEADAGIMLVNDTAYGGSGGGWFVCGSLHKDSAEIIVHELAHTIAGVNDEYWPGDELAGESPNMTQQNDPDKVVWHNYIGREGIGVYPYEDGPDGWYKPSLDCKMAVLGKEHPFCLVCRDAILRGIGRASVGDPFAFTSAAARGETAEEKAGDPAFRYLPWLFGAAFVGAILLIFSLSAIRKDRLRRTIRSRRREAALKAAKSRQAKKGKQGTARKGGQKRNTGRKGKGR